MARRNPETSKLLINEQPLQVLPSLAVQIGLDEGIFLQQLHYWLQRSKHEHDGRTWVYNTFEEWRAQFPFWTLSKMQRIAANLVKRKLMIVRKFRKGDWDRTNWYSIEYDAVAVLAATVPDKIIEIEKRRDEVSLARHRRFTGELS